MEHIPVLLNEAIEALNIKEDGVYIDCTLGGGGHSEAILSRLKNGHLYAFDQDDYAIAQATERLKPYIAKLTIIRDNFVNIIARLKALNITEVDGILFDLGVSSYHFDDPSRGFSYNHEAPLDMRMDQTRSLTAKGIVNTYDERDIKMLLYRYADETMAPRIAKAIVQARAVKSIETTFELVDIIKRALPQKVLSKKGHPAKKTFQALRIAVNDELRVFEDALQDALTLLKKDGRIAVISFHSLEDRIAKHIFKEATSIDHPIEIVTMPTVTPDFALVHKGIVRPSDEECIRNNRAHSAKLRAIKKL